MGELVPFRPRAELEASQNMRMFLELCRDRLTVFGENLRFDENVWDVTESLALKGRSGAMRVVFSTLASVVNNTPTMLPEPFCSFAKSYLRYQHGVRPNKSIGVRLTALRAVHAALTENGEDGDPVHIHADVLNRAAQLVKERYTRGVAYTVGIQLEILSDFMRAHRLTAVPVQWRNPIVRPVDNGRVGPEFDERREKKLPSPEALDALATAFRRATDPSDVLVCSIAALLCSAPERINEVLLLSVDCEVNHERQGERTYGLRWWSAKGAEPQTKWIVPSMADVVREALANIRHRAMVRTESELALSSSRARASPIRVAADDARCRQGVIRRARRQGRTTTVVRAVRR